MLRGAPKSLKGIDAQEQRCSRESTNKEEYPYFLMCGYFLLQLSELIHYHAILSDIFLFSGLPVQWQHRYFTVNQIRQMKKTCEQGCYYYPQHACCFNFRLSRHVRQWLPDVLLLPGTALVDLWLVQPLAMLEIIIEK